MLDKKIQSPDLSLLPIFLSPIFLLLPLAAYNAPSIPYDCLCTRNAPQKRNPLAWPPNRSRSINST